jgi:hypothetical protein
MVVRARRKRRTFRSRESVREFFSSAKMTSGWTTDALEAFCDGVVRERDAEDKTRCGSPEDEFVLKCEPLQEAEVYASAAVSAPWPWDQLRKLPRLLLAAGARSTTYGNVADPSVRGSLDWHALVAHVRDRPRTEIEVVDTGHFIPMEDPSFVAERVLQLISSAVEDIGAPGAKL